MESPFQYGTIAQNENFIDRVEERALLKQLLSSGVNVMLISPRRWGKSSLVKNAMDELTREKKNIKVCYIDAFSINSEAEFYRTFASRVMSCAYNRLDKGLESAKKLLSGIVPQLVFKDTINEFLTIDVRFKPQEKDKIEILQLPERIAKQRGIRIIVCIDEFQQVGEFPDSLTVQKRMRSVWQHQNNVSYCLFGSKMHMMTNLFQKKSYPFYKFGEMLYLKPIPLDSWTTYISERFAQAGKQISAELIQQLCETVEYHASYVQQLAYSTLLLAQDGVTYEVLTAAVEDLIAQNASIFIEQTQSLTSYQLNFLRAILYGVNNGFNEKAVRESFDLGVPSNIARLKKSLIDKELIEYTEKGVEIGDPVLRLWLKRVLFQ